MKRILSIGALLIAAALTGQAGASMQSNPNAGMGETSQEKSQQGVGVEGAGSPSVNLVGPEILLGRIEKIDHNDLWVRGDRGQSLNLQISKDTNLVCSTDRSGFVVGSSECDFQPGDLVRIEASDVGTMTTITRLASKEDESGSQIANEKELNATVQ